MKFGGIMFIRVRGHQFSVRLTVRPPFAHIRSISRMSKISREFLDQRCDLCSGKYGTYIQKIQFSLSQSTDFDSIGYWGQHALLYYSSFSEFFFISLFSVTQTPTKLKVMNFSHCNPACSVNYGVCIYPILFTK